MTITALKELYASERARLLALCDTDAPAGMYASPVFGEGPEAPFLVLVGEAPGAEETRLSHPFVGKAGRQLDELLSVAGIPRDEVYITNAVKYRPVTVSARSVRNRTPAREEILSSLPLLRKELLLLRPRCIATLGNVPLFAVLSLFGQQKKVVGDVHGSALDVSMEEWDTMLFPLYHPASTIYNRALLPVCLADATALGELCAVNKR